MYRFSIKKKKKGESVVDNLFSFNGEIQENVMSYFRKHSAFSPSVVWERANNKIIK